MSFTLVQGTKTKLTITSGVLLQSKNANGSQAAPLASYGPQSFSCHPEGCSAMAYGFSDYQRLELRFSDGKTRRSNVFSPSGLSSSYTVTVREKDLLVEPAADTSPVKRQSKPKP
jgi:hypothetical protein